MDNFLDYYQILQVHQDAEQDVIEAAYKKLCKKYHPDLCRLPEAEERMKEINIAYEVLGDAHKRALYTLDWRRHRFVRQAPPPPANNARTIDSQRARRIMDEYFQYLSEESYPRAYELLSEADKRNITLASFTEWQQSVREIYAVRKCVPRVIAHYDEFAVDDRHGCAAKRFEIEMTEENKLTGAISRYKFHKYAVSESEGAWRVYLGYRDLSHLVDQFRHMASTKDEAGVLHSFKRRRDANEAARGLLNRKGFLERAASEQYRFKRYRRPFAMAVMHISVPEGLASNSVTAQAGHTFSKLLRAIDILGYIDSDRYAVLLAEITKESARTVVERISRHVAKELRAAFDINVTVKYSVRQYAGEELEALLATLCQRLPAKKSERKAN